MNSWMKGFAGRVFDVLKAQWIATALVFPIIILSISTCVANEQARSARMQAARIEKISAMQESGQALDAALAGYFNALAQLGLSEQGLKVPSEYEVLPVPRARDQLITARSGVTNALVEHAGDLQALRGSLNLAETNSYMSELADIRAVVDKPAQIENTGANVSVLSSLVVARNTLVDEALEQAS